MIPNTIRLKDVAGRPTEKMGGRWKSPGSGEVL